jgi:hypothetical protein
MLGIKGRYVSVCVIPVGLGQPVHFYVELAPRVEEMVGNVLVLVAAYVSRCPDEGARCYFSPDFVDKIVMWLVWGIVLMIKHCRKA